MDCFCGGTGEPRVVSGGEYLDRKQVNEYCSCPSGVATKIAPIWDRAEIPKRFRDFTLESSPHDFDFTMVEVLFRAESFFFHGPVGRGKTGLAVGLARKCIESGLVAQVLFVDVPDLLSQIKDTYGKDEESERAILKRYKEAELLILDDLGAEHTQNLSWLQDLAYQIINYRHGEMLPTIFTSNLSLGDLGERIGSRNAWRIRELCGAENIIEISGKNLREN